MDVRADAIRFRQYCREECAVDARLLVTGENQGVASISLAQFEARLRRVPMPRRALLVLCLSNEALLWEMVQRFAPDRIDEVRPWSKAQVIAGGMVPPFGPPLLMQALTEARIPHAALLDAAIGRSPRLLMPLCHGAVVAMWSFMQDVQPLFRTTVLRSPRDPERDGRALGFLEEVRHVVESWPDEDPATRCFQAGFVAAYDTVRAQPPGLPWHLR